MPVFRCLPAAVTAALFGLSAAPVIGEPLPRFPAPAVWNQDITTAALDPESASMISTLDGLGGFGLGRLQIDFSFHVVRAPRGSPRRAIVGLDYYSPDCVDPGTTMPVPAGSAIEGQMDLDCDNQNGDCHLLVVEGDTLYEAYRATQLGPTEIESQCLAIWRLGTVYPPEGRGEHCTSADAAGFPIAPLLFNADEIAAALAIDPSGDSDVGHAIRFILPNARMASDGSLGGVAGRLYVRPASHAGGPSGPTASVPYGARLRLRADFPLTGYVPAARVILNSFKRYGIVLADGGNVALTAESDLYTTTSWADLGIDSRVFDQTTGAATVTIADFEVVDTGPRIGETYDCVRSCASTAAPVTLLMAVRNGDDVDLSWTADPAAAAYNAWYVASKEQIPDARQATAPPAVGVGGCATPDPAMAATCTDMGAVPRDSPAVFYYQVRAYCDPASEGP